MQAFGLVNLLRFRFGLGPIHHIFRRVSRQLKVDVAPLLVSDGRTAIDVDNDRSLRVTEVLMARRDVVSPRPNCRGDRKSVVWGKRVSVRVDLGGRRLINKKKTES